jgi:hypothetical protein
VDAAVADPPDPVRSTSHLSSRTLACTAPCRSKSRRDRVRPDTPAAKWAIDGLKATCVAAPLAPIASLQLASS